MNGHSRHLGSGGEPDIFRAGSLKHFRSRDCRIAHQRRLIFSMRHADAQGWDAPRVFQVGIDFAKII